MSANYAPVRIERAHNGWIVTLGAHRLGDPAPPLPMVFDDFERMVGWLAEKYGLDRKSNPDKIAWSLMQGPSPSGVAGGPLGGPRQGG